MVTSSMPMRGKIRTAAQLCAVLLLIAVGTTGRSRNSTGGAPQGDELLLHVQYLSGGDAPIGMIISFFEDGRVRYESPRRKISWSKLAVEDLQTLSAILESPTLRESVDDLTGTPFGCCDLEEIGLAIGSSSKLVSIDLQAPEELLQPLAPLFRYVNEVGRDSFGRNYSLPLPIQNGH